MVLMATPAPFNACQGWKLVASGGGALQQQGLAIVAKMARKTDGEATLCRGEADGGLLRPGAVGMRPRPGKIADETMEYSAAS